MVKGTIISIPYQVFDLDIISSYTNVMNQSAFRPKLHSLKFLMTEPIFPND
jgi:hypothetical protein